MTLFLASSVTAPEYQVTQGLRNSLLMTNKSDSYFVALPSTVAGTDAAGLGLKKKKNSL